MKPHVITLSLVLLFPAAMAQWQNPLRRKLLVFASAGTPAATTTSSAKNAPRRYIIPSRPSTRLVAPPVEVNGRQTHFTPNARLVDDRTLVPLREFIAALQPHISEQISVEWENGEVRIVVQDKKVTANPVDAFGLALVNLWDGKLSEARRLLQTTREGNGAYAADASGLLSWIERDGFEATIRFEWWNMPHDASVKVDGEPIPSGTLYALTTAGEHTIAIHQGDATEPFLSKTVVVKSQQVLRVGVRNEGS